MYFLLLYGTFIKTRSPTALFTCGRLYDVRYCDVKHIVFNLIAVLYKLLSIFNSIVAYFPYSCNARIAYRQIPPFLFLLFLKWLYHFKVSRVEQERRTNEVQAIKDFKTFNINTTHCSFIVACCVLHLRGGPYPKSMTIDYIYRERFSGKEYIRK